LGDKSGVITTLSLLALTVLIFALALGFATHASSTTFYPPTPLLLSSARTYEEWLAYHYTQAYLSAVGYTLNQNSYAALLEDVANSLQGERTMVYSVDGARGQAWIWNSQVQYLLQYPYPQFSLKATIYVPSEKAFFNVSYTVSSPIRYYIAQQLLAVVASLPDNATLQQVSAALNSYVEAVQDIRGTLTVESYGGQSAVDVGITDCSLEIYFGVCPTYLASEVLEKVLPNLTLSFSSPA